MHVWYSLYYSKITAVNTLFLLGFSDYVSCLALRSFKKTFQIIKKIADTIGENKNSACLTYILMIPAREFILNIK